MRETHDFRQVPNRKKKVGEKKIWGNWKRTDTEREICFAARITRPVSAPESRNFSLFFLFFFPTSFSIWGTALDLFRLGFLGSVRKDNEAKGVNLGHHSRHAGQWYELNCGE